MDPSHGFTEAVRQELASHPFGNDREAWAELAGLARCAGRLTVVGGSTEPRARHHLAVVSTSGAVARRAYGLIQQRFEVRPELAVRAAGGVRRRASYEVRLGKATAFVVADLGLLDDEGRPAVGLPVVAGGREALPFLRGAVLACASFSSPGRHPHLEFAPGSSATARGLSELVAAQVGGSVAVTIDERPRTVLKSGEVIGDLLVAVGATNAFLRWDEHRMRKQLRGAANRLANADAANLRRTIDAATEQVRAVEAVIERLGWEELDDDLREIALARLANPGASLQELGQLLDPPVGKSAVHRRLRRVMELGSGVTTPREDVGGSGPSRTARESERGPPTDGDGRP